VEEEGTDAAAVRDPVRTSKTAALATARPLETTCVSVSEEEKEIQ